MTPDQVDGGGGSDANAVIDHLSSATDGANGKGEAATGTLAEWLDAIAKLAGYESGQALVSDTGVCCWMDFFHDGYSPAEAWAEECDNG